MTSQYPHIKDTVTGRIGQVAYVRHDEGAGVIWSCNGWCDFVPKAKLNSGRYEMMESAA